MIDLLLLAGVALCVLSVVMAIVSVARTHAPRGAALALVLGLVALLVASFSGEQHFGFGSVQQAWQRVTTGEAFGTNTVTAPPPAATEQPSTGAPATTAGSAPQAAMQDNTSGENPAAPDSGASAAAEPTTAEPTTAEPTTAAPAPQVQQPSQ